MTAPTNKPETCFINLVGDMYTGRASFIATICDEYNLGGNEAREEHLRPENLHKTFYGVYFNFGKIFLLAEAVCYLHSGPYSVSKSYLTIIEDVAAGIIVFIDSSRPETFKKAGELIRSISSTPFVVAANKQDLPDAWTAQDIRTVISIASEIPVVPCSIYDNKSIANVLLALCAEMLKQADVTEAEI